MIPAGMDAGYLRSLAPDVDFVSLRTVDERRERLCVRNDLVQPIERRIDRGGMVTVEVRGGIGYAATSNLSPEGLARAVQRATSWALTMARCAPLWQSGIRWHQATGQFESRQQEAWSARPTRDKVELLQDACRALAHGPYIVDREASLGYAHVETRMLTSAGGDVRQTFHILQPDLRATAHHEGETQSRTFGSMAQTGQGGLEGLVRSGFLDAAPRVAAEASELLFAPNCPSGTFDLLLAPDQMILQIHESIGHPLELDRILGDERNYAGSSFVTLDMFGSYAYGSPLLNVSFDPTVEGQLASYAFDDEGTPAGRTLLIEEGILKRPLGATLSQHRSGLEGVANARASSWNRPPIDRMANLNVEPGTSSLADMISSVEQGVFMRTNRSWSIDDTRNKFQFGCEWAQRIEEGRLTHVVKNPNYRGVSANFWRNLSAVGDAATFEVLGTPYCGKGEPNQLVRVGHASPACLFSTVDVFGGEESRP